MIHDVVDGIVSIEAAGRSYGVVIRCLAPDGEIVRLPEDYEMDVDATRQLRARMGASPGA